MQKRSAKLPDRSTFIGGSDARIVMGHDGAALTRLWQEKRGEREPEDLSRNLAVQLGTATEPLNRLWFQQETQRRLERVQAFLRHPTLSFMGATLDGMVVGDEAVFEAKFMLPWTFSEESAVQKHMAQLQHTMLVTGASTAFLSIITGGGKWCLVEVPADRVYQTVMVQIERIFWRCIKSGERPNIFDAPLPQAAIAAVRTIDMNTSNAWAEHAAAFQRTRAAHAEHETAKLELKRLVPDDAREAFGHGLRARRSKVGAISFDVVANGGAHAPLQ